MNKRGIGPRLRFDSATPRRVTRGKSRRLNRYAILALGLTAIATFLFALPGAALACVISCPGGTIGVNGMGQPYCIGGVNSGQLVCSGGGFGNPFTNDPIPIELYLYTLAGNLIAGLGGGGPNPDPFADFTSIHDRGAAMSSAAGAFSGPSVASRTTDVGGGADASFNASKTFSLAANQRLVLYGQFRYDSFSTTSDASALAPGFANTGSAHNNTYTFLGVARYYVGSSYFGAGAAGNFGRGSMTNNIDGGVGSFNSQGYAAGTVVGNVFTLFDSRSVQSSPLPTKAPPRPTGGGYALQLDLSGHVVYANDQVDSFTDSAGLIWGTQQAHFWTAGAQARLFATIPTDQWTWVPYVSAKFDQQFDYSNSLDVPAQALATADNISYGNAQTFVGTEMGLSVQAPNGIVVGVRGFYNESAEFRTTGGQAYLYIAAKP